MQICLQTTTTIPSVFPWEKTNIYQCQSSFHLWNIWKTILKYPNNFNNEFKIKIFYLLKNLFLCWILIEMLGTEVWVTDCGSHDGASSLLCLQNSLHHHCCIISLPSQVLAIQRFVGTLKININKVYFSYFLKSFFTRPKIGQYER